MDFLKTLLLYMGLTVALTVEGAVPPDQIPVPTPEPTSVAIVSTVLPEPEPTPAVTAAPEAKATPTPTLRPVPTITPGKGYRILKQGARGDDVKRLQEKLIELGYLKDKADGVYGGKTRNAVLDFQKNNGLTRDGVAGKMTQTYLYENPDVLNKQKKKLSELNAPEETAVPEIAPEPTVELTAEPTAEPTVEPTEVPTAEPTEAPTVEPTAEPTAEPTEAPTVEPTAEPTAEPTEAPTAEPTEAPTAEPTEAPTVEPTVEPTAEPTEVPTAEPTEAPTAEPSAEPTAEPTEIPTEEPTAEPSAEPTDVPTAEIEVGGDLTESEMLEDDEFEAPLPMNGKVAMNEIGEPLSWLVTEDGVPVRKYPRMWIKNGEVWVSLSDLSAATEGWELEENSDALILEAEGYVVVVMYEDEGLLALVDGTEVALERNEILLNTEGYPVKLSFLKKTLKADTVWEEEEKTVMIRTVHKDLANAED